MKFKGHKPEDIHAEEVRRVKESLSRQPRKLDWFSGERIEVLDGPFKGMKGHIDSVEADRQKVRATIKVFGRDTPVELHFAEIELDNSG